MYPVFQHKQIQYHQSIDEANNDGQDFGTAYTQHHRNNTGARYFVVGFIVNIKRQGDKKNK